MPKLINCYVGGRIHYAPHLKGSGMGSVLMQKGGTGSASSYESPEAYEQMTGQSTKSSSGLNDKLSKLMVKPLNKKMNGNISFKI